ncbi:MAG: hypothetical protein LBL61_05895 [Elusimicrobiota bacterium]|nr:hypothetical protein [Elusimicrobiota bacterium]
MSPSHSNKKGKRYRYYLSQAVIRQEKQKIGEVTKIAVGEIERFVSEIIKGIFENVETIQNLLKDLPLTTQKEILKKSKEINPTPQIIRDTISRIKLFKEKVEIAFYPEYIKEVLLSHYESRKLRPEIKIQTEEAIVKDIRVAVVDNGSKIIIGAGDEKQEQNEQLIKAILRAYKWNKKLKKSTVFSRSIVCEEENIGERYMDKILKLAYLSPKIIQSILNGTQPRDITFQRLTEINTTDWSEQERFLNIK